MINARILLAGLVLGLAALAGAHHESSRGTSAHPASGSHAAAPEAGPRAFVSVFTGGDFVKLFPRAGVKESQK